MSDLIEGRYCSDTGGADMICQHTNVKCRMFRCLHQKGCVFPPEPPPKPTLAEIERLVDAFESAVSDPEHENYSPARAAFLAAIRAATNQDA